MTLCGSYTLCQCVCQCHHCVCLYTVCCSYILMDWLAEVSEMKSFPSATVHLALPTGTCLDQQCSKLQLPVHLLGEREDDLLSKINEFQFDNRVKLLAEHCFELKASF